MQASEHLYATRFLHQLVSTYHVSMHLTFVVNNNVQLLFTKCHSRACSLGGLFQWQTSARTGQAFEAFHSASVKSDAL